MAKTVNSSRNRPVGKPNTSTSWRNDKRKTSERGYGWEWQKLRLVHLEKNPICVMCQKRGRIIPATVVDHIKPHRGDKTLQYDPNNLQSLCKPHHDSEKQMFEKSGKTRLVYNADGTLAGDTAKPTPPRKMF